MTSRISILIIFIVATFVSLTSGWLFEHDGVFPFASWELFSDFWPVAEGFVLVIHDPVHGDCEIRDCGYSANRYAIQMLWGMAWEIRGHAQRDNPQVKIFMSSVDSIAERKVDFTLYFYKFDMKNLKRVEETRETILSSRDLKL